MDFEQLPESKRYAGRLQLEAELRRQSRRKTLPAVSVMLKLPADLAAWVSEAAGSNGFDSRQGFILNVLKKRRESSDGQEEARIT